MRWIPGATGRDPAFTMSRSAMASDPPLHDVSEPAAVLALTANGVALALRLAQALGCCTVHVPRRHGFALAMGAEPFDRLRDRVSELWKDHGALVFIMATGIVVRSIAPLLRHKSRDPAVVVVDEKGRFVISLLSGHLGGANRLAGRHHHGHGRDGKGRRGSHGPGGGP
jgi:cobalt-precorrin 5A hydrolase